MRICDMCLSTGGNINEATVKMNVVADEMVGVVDVCERCEQILMDELLRVVRNAKKRTVHDITSLTPTQACQVAAVIARSVEEATRKPQ